MNDVFCLILFVHINRYSIIIHKALAIRLEYVEGKIVLH